MELRVRFPGNARVAAEFDGFTVMTDQPKEGGGDGEAPTPFDLFLASIATCAGIFALGFCRKRGIPTQGLGLVQRVEFDESGARAAKITLELSLPDDFPDKYVDSIVSAIAACKVKKHILNPPAFSVRSSRRARA